MFFFFTVKGGVGGVVARGPISERLTRAWWGRAQKSGGPEVVKNDCFWGVVMQVM